MWKYLAALLVVLLSLGGLVTAQPTHCADCYANMILQSDTQTVDNVRLALGGGSVAVGNEGLSAGIIVTQAPDTTLTGDVDNFFVPAPFARIDQTMTQTVSNIGNLDLVNDPTRTGAKGITWNKAIQAAWLANQGVKEYQGEVPDEYAEYVKEGTYVNQSTTQLTDNIFDYDSREHALVLNVDNKLAMVVDDVSTILNLQANANSTTASSESVLAEFNDLGSINLKGNNTS
jgi:hypothetical protein